MPFSQPQFHKIFYLDFRCLFIRHGVTLQEPYISSFEPTFGPESGGTVVTIATGFLGDIRNVTVGFGPLPCSVRRNSSSPSRLVCSTAPLGNSSHLLGRSLSVTVNLTSGYSLSVPGSFLYMIDPTITDVTPLRTFER